MPTSPLPVALLMPGYFPIVGHACVHDYITVRCPLCLATYVLALPRLPKFAGTVHTNVDLLRASWGNCGAHPVKITMDEKHFSASAVS